MMRLAAAAAPLTGLLLLAGVVKNAFLTDAEVIVHVTEPDIEAAVAGRMFRIGVLSGDPIVCGLAPREHEPVMRRGGRARYRETFTVRGGESVVLTAWNPNRPHPPEGRDPKRRRQP
jgi:hypothetical protein